MNISKQAIEAGAKAEFERWIRSSQQSRRWDDPNEHSTRENCRESATVVLTAALEHIAREVLGPPTAEEREGWTLASSQRIADFLAHRLTQLTQETSMPKVFTDTKQAVQDILIDGKPCASSQVKETSPVPPASKENVTEVAKPDDVERVARAMWDMSKATGRWKGDLPKASDDLGKLYRKEATAAIRAMKGESWGVWNGTHNCWYACNFNSTDKNAVEMLCASIQAYGHTALGKRIVFEVRPYAAPREESAEEIAKRELQDIADNGLRCDTNPTIQITTSANDTAFRYVQYIRQIDSTMRDRAKSALEAIREAEKRGAAKCG